jgi:glutathione reductase (NADPH)
MASFDFDLFVIGGGSGGVRASRIAASHGARVAVAEHYRMGGTCVIRGCVPKKLLVYASHFHEEFEDARNYGWTVGERSFSWPTLIANKNKEIARLEGIYQRLLENSKVKTYKARARLLDRNTVDVGGERVSAKVILIATGGWPVMPAMPGVEHCISSNEAFELPAQPRRMLVVGGGYIALEFAGIFRGLGSEVTVSYRRDRILRGFDGDVRNFLQAELGKKGIRLALNSVLQSVEKRADGTLVATLNDPHGTKALQVDAVMLATGRAPNTKNLGLEALGVKLNSEGGVVVDEYSRSSIDNIYAVGDVTHRFALTPVAIREGQAFANTVFGNLPTPIDHETIPTSVFSQPPVGTVGLTEEAALKRYPQVDVYKADFKPLKHTLSGRDERTLMKLIVHSENGRVLGAHMVGADGPEIIQGVAIAVKAGLTKAQFDATCAIHPTAAEEFVTLRDKKTVSAPAA